MRHRLGLARICHLDHWQGSGAKVPGEEEEKEEEEEEEEEEDGEEVMVMDDCRWLVGLR